jgi:hypothetical protein
MDMKHEKPRHCGGESDGAFGRFQFGQRRLAAVTGHFPPASGGPSIPVPVPGSGGLVRAIPAARFRAPLGALAPVIDIEPSRAAAAAPVGIVLSPQLAEWRA